MLALMLALMLVLMLALMLVLLVRLLLGSPEGPTVQYFYADGPMHRWWVQKSKKIKNELTSNQ